MSTIVTINSTDLITNSRANINTNFANLNADKIETSVLDTDTTLAANSDSKVATQKATKAYVDSIVTVNASETVKGAVEEATQAEVEAGTAAGGTGARLFINPSKTILPQSISMYSGVSVVNSVLFYSDKVATVCNSNSINLAINVPSVNSGIVDLTTILAGADRTDACVILGDYIYILITETSTTPDTKAVWRVNLSDFSTKSVMTFSGATVLTNTDQSVIMTSDGTNFFFSFAAGSSATSYQVAKYSLSGTTLTYVSTITLGSTALLDFAAKADGTFIGHTTTSTNTELKKYDSSGTVTTTKASFFKDSGDVLCNILDSIYVFDGTFAVGFKVKP